MSTAAITQQSRAITTLERAALLLVGVGLLTITVVTFVTSFDAVSAVAAERGAVSERFAWAIPLAIDGLIVVGSAAAWLESLRGGRWHPFPVTLVAVAGGLSVAANVAHAPGTDILARLLAAVPPVALLSAVELGAWLMRRQVRRSHAATSVGSLPVSAGTPELSAGDTEATGDATVPTRDRITAALRAHVEAGGDLEEVSKGTVARAAGVNRSTVYKHWDAAVEAVSTNGSRA